MEFIAKCPGGYRRFMM